MPHRQGQTDQSGPRPWPRILSRVKRQVGSVNLALCLRSPDLGRRSLFVYSGRGLNVAGSLNWEWPTFSHFSWNGPIEPLKFFFKVGPQVFWPVGLEEHLEIINMDIIYDGWPARQSHAIMWRTEIIWNAADVKCLSDGSSLQEDMVILTHKNCKNQPKIYLNHTNRKQHWVQIEENSQ